MFGMINCIYTFFSRNVPVWHAHCPDVRTHCRHSPSRRGAAIDVYDVLLQRAVCRSAWMVSVPCNAVHLTKHRGQQQTFQFSQAGPSTPGFVLPCRHTFCVAPTLFGRAGPVLCVRGGAVVHSQTRGWCHVAGCDGVWPSPRPSAFALLSRR